MRKDEILWFALLRPSYGCRTIDIRARPTVRYYNAEGIENTPCLTITFDANQNRKHGFRGYSTGIWVSYGREFYRNDTATYRLLSVAGHLHFTKGKRNGKR